MSNEVYQPQKLTPDEAELFFPLISDALAKNPDAIETQLRYAETIAAMGRRPEALELLQKLASNHPEHAQLRGALLHMSCADDPVLSAAIADMATILVNLYGMYLVQPAVHVNLALHMQHMPYLNRNLGHIADVMFSTHYPDLCALDMGSYIGSSVAEMNSKHHIPCLSVDCWPRHFAQTRHNLQFIRGDHQAVMVAIGKDNDVLNILLPNRYTDADHIFLSDMPPGTENKLLGTVATISLQTLLNNYPAYRHFKLLKLDLEGNEPSVLQASADVLRQNKPVIFWEYNYEYVANLHDAHRAFQGSFTLLRDLGYVEHLFFKSSGEFLCRVPANQLDQLDSLSASLLLQRHAGVFCDVCSLHADDADLAEPILQKTLPTEIFAAVYGK